MIQPTPMHIASYGALVPHQRDRIEQLEQERDVLLAQRALLLSFVENNADASPFARHVMRRPAVTEADRLARSRLIDHFHATNEVFAEAFGFAMAAERRA